MQSLHGLGLNFAHLRNGTDLLHWIWEGRAGEEGDLVVGGVILPLQNGCGVWR